MAKLCRLALLTCGQRHDAVEYLLPRLIQRRLPLCAT